MENAVSKNMAMMDLERVLGMFTQTAPTLRPNYFHFMGNSKISFGRLRKQTNSVNLNR